MLGSVIRTVAGVGLGSSRAWPRLVPLASTRGLQAAAPCLRAEASPDHASNTGRMYASLLLERYPIIMAEQPAWEKEYQDWSFERQNEKRHEVPEELLSATYSEDNTADFNWTPAPRVTRDDVAKNTKSLNRELDKKLYLLVKYKEGGWQFPQVAHKEGQTMREAAEVAAESVATMEDVFVLGNPPSGHLKIEPEGSPVGGAQAGDTLFYYRASYLAKKYDLPEEAKSAAGVIDFAWLTNTEVWTDYITGQQADFMKKLIISPPRMDPEFLGSLLPTQA